LHRSLDTIPLKPATIKTLLALAVIAAGGESITKIANAPRPTVADGITAFGAPSMNSRPIALSKREWYCEKTNTPVNNCTNVEYPEGTPQKCRDACLSSWAASACIKQASGNYVPDLTFNPTEEPNNQTLECYRNILCPKFGEYVSCWQCILDHAPLTGNVTKESMVNTINEALPELPAYCQSIGVNASSYTPLVAGARSTAVSGSLLLVFGVAAASLL